MDGSSLLHRHADAECRATSARPASPSAHTITAAYAGDTAFHHSVFGSTYAERGRADVGTTTTLNSSLTRPSRNMVVSLRTVTVSPGRTTRRTVTFMEFGVLFTQRRQQYGQLQALSLARLIPTLTYSVIPFPRSVSSRLRKPLTLFLLSVNTTAT